MLRLMINRVKSEMKRRLLLSLILLLSAHGASGQDKPKLIGEIEFYGYSGSGIDLDKVRAALPFHEQENFSAEAFAEEFEQSAEAVKGVTGRFPTEMGKVCCDRRGDIAIFIGLSGKAIPYNPRPSGTARLPKKILDLYERFMQTLNESVQKGDFAEDRAKGYALSAYPPLRSVQMEMRAYAVAHAATLRSVLETSAEDQQRIVAAQVLGYARQSGSQLVSLAKATRDSNGTVRNNATRALVVLAKSRAEITRRIPVAGFIEALLSGTWTDLNKSGNLLDIITEKNRDVKVLAQFQRNEVLERLIEMARWRTHWEPAANLLGRIAGINEQRLKRLVDDGKAEVIIKELQDRRGKDL